MNIKGGSKYTIDLKKKKLKRELQKPKHEQNQNKIKRLKASIKRNKNIAHIICQRRRRRLQRRLKRQGGN
jgi:hypothetical protein